VTDGIRAVCSRCGAKYRLPVEAAGRAARCKKCGEKFEVPRAKTLEDSVLDWLSEPDAAEEAIELPRVINMPKETASDDSSKIVRAGPIRMKNTPPH
jgi:DNA-directed RNA polymerase subunit RPC12/RpoP